MSSVLDIMAITLFMLHDTMDSTWGAVLTIVVQTTSELPLLVLMMALINVAASVAAAPVLVEVGAQVSTPRGVCTGLVDFLLDGGELVVRRSIRLTMQMSARRRCRGLGRRAPLFHQGCGDPEVSHSHISLGSGVGLLETRHSRTKVVLRAVERWQPHLFELEV
jgi:hypothetical protein